MTTLRQLAVETLTHMVESGQERLAVDDEARGILRQWMLDARKGSQPAPPVPVAESTPAPRAEQPEMSVEEKLDFLRQKAADWKPARRLGTLREKMVFAVGNPHARLMLVGEAPGYEEERQGEPFVGPAGQLLTRILGAMGLQRSDVYISNVCKFRPSMGENQGTSNRAPSPEELAACQPLIMAEIRAIQPACIVCLGGSSAKGLLGTQQGVSALRGQWFECQGVPVRVTYHPSYLLRNEALSARRSVWEDMLEVMQRLGMPISEKQQNYFR
ncbi:MAG: uracil-DNA glycosylase [Akkermansia sp.]|nr:uracil-DNA glycosylase [Akkermansia sp.]MBR5195454.1 uracil-DNA glycosylase [Akkermansia sp.]